MKYFEKRKLEKYLANLENHTFPHGYIEVHKDKIDCLKWLVASYEGRATSPRELLNALLDPMKKITESDLDWIRVLYHWITYKQIVGF